MIKIRLMHYMFNNCYLPKKNSMLVLTHVFIYHKVFENLFINFNGFKLVNYRTPRPYRILKQKSAVHLCKKSF